MKKKNSANVLEAWTLRANGAYNYWLGVIPKEVKGSPVLSEKIKWEPYVWLFLIGADVFPFYWNYNHKRKFLNYEENSSHREQPLII